MPRILLCALCVVATAPIASAAAEEVERPNIVFLLADDLGWTGLRCFGSDYYDTPNLDKLAAQGVRFTDAYAACTVCSPTRASIMTGVYPAKLRLTDFIAGQNRPWARMRIPDWNKGLDPKLATIGEALRAGGYRTGYVGKWHLDSPKATAANRGPRNHGFDRQFLKPKAARGYFLPDGFNREGESKSDYLTDYLTDQALAFIDGAKDQPFFLYFAFHTPHTPIQGRADLVERYTRKVDPKATHNNPVYAAMVANMDMNVGRILRRLEQRELAKRTLVIFTSDNGGLTQRYGKHDGFTQNLPLRRGKGSAYEGGVRVPTIVRWPGVAAAGAVCRSPVISTDYYPTLLEAGKTKGDARHNRLLDGESLLPLLGEPGAVKARSLFWHYPHYHAGGDGPYSAVRSGEWRLVEFHDDQRVELYNLRTDLAEQKNVAAQSPDRAKKLRRQLHDWRTKVAAQMPTRNPDYDPEREAQVRRR